MNQRMTSKYDRDEAEYFQWLCNVVQADEPDHSYLILMKILHNQPFYSSILLDENRAKDGIFLTRIQYVDQNRRSRISMDAPCSVLEMMIGLAFRMDDILEDDTGEDRTTVWFWDMIQNLGLDEYTDDRYADDPFFEATVHHILRTLLDREYTRSGKGSLFPLKKSRQDQRKTEIWYQLHAYLKEKYPIRRIERV